MKPFRSSALEIASAQALKDTQQLRDALQATPGGDMTAAEAARRERDEAFALAERVIAEWPDELPPICILARALLAQAERHKAEMEEARKVIDGIERAFVSVLNKGYHRIKDLGGDCDTLDVMERGEPALSTARAFLAKHKEPIDGK